MAKQNEASSPAAEPTTPAATPVVAAPKPSVMFREPAGKPDAKFIADKHAAKKGATIAHADVLNVLPGAFATLAIADFSLSLMPDKTITVYMPSDGVGWRARRHIAPRQIKLQRPIVRKGETIEYEDDPNGVAATDLLASAVRAAWVVACENASKIPGGNPFGVEVPLSL